MENITLGQISLELIFLLTLIGSLVKLFQYIKTTIKTILESEFEFLSNKMVDLKNEIKESRKESNKNFLVRCFDDIENGRVLGSITIERLHESFKKYEDDGGNGYIHARYEKLKKEGKL